MLSAATTRRSEAPSCPPPWGKSPLLSSPLGEGTIAPPSEGLGRLFIANIKSQTAPRRVSLVSVPSSMMRIGLVYVCFAAHSSKIWANLWFVTITCSVICGMRSISSIILPSIVVLPISRSGFGKFFVSSPRRVA